MSESKNETLEGDIYASEYYKSEKGYTWTNFDHAEADLVEKCHEKGVGKNFEHGSDDRGKPWWWRWSKYEYTNRETGEKKFSNNIFRSTQEEHNAFVAKYPKKGTSSTVATLSPPKDLPPASLHGSSSTTSSTSNPVTDSPYGFPQYIFVALKGLTDTDGLDSVKTWRQAGWIEDEYTTLHSPKGLGVRMMKK